jgi:uncharacterized protein with ParB-like and HNH nuclease domain
MNANSERILTYMFENRRQYCIPVYQRNYDWKRDNCVTLFDDIKNLINTEKNTFLVLLFRFLSKKRMVLNAI